MQEVLEFILKNITTTPDDVKVESHDEDGVINFTISVHSDDVGRVIGKEGKVIKAIRTIMRVIAIQKDLRVRVSVLSDQNEQPVIVEEAAPVVEITPEPAPETPEVQIPAEEDSLTVEV
jgi:uncharacterized protein